MMRRSRDFRTVEDYDCFVQKAVAERDSKRERVSEELKVLKQPSKEVWYEPRQHSLTVSGWSTVSIEGATYSVPSRFIGQKLKALLDSETMRIYYNRHLVKTERRKVYQLSPFDFSPTSKTRSLPQLSVSGRTLSPRCF